MKPQFHERIATTITADWVEVTIRWSTWEAIPAQNRLTPELLKIEYPGYSAHAIRKLLHPDCIVAVRSARFPTKWRPCRQEVADGHKLCAAHGGPSVVDTRKAERVHARELVREGKRAAAHAEDAVRTESIRDLLLAVAPISGETEVSELPFRTRIQNVLRREGIRTVSHLLAIPAGDLEYFRGLGKSSLLEFEALRSVVNESSS